MKTLLFIFIIMVGFLSFAQQDAQYTQYMYNTISVNPAYAGSRGILSVIGLYRSQWVGLDGAPKTQTLSVNTPVGNSVGLGFSIVNDQIGDGVNEETSFDVAFSYTVPTSEKGKLSFGLKAGGHLLNIDFTVLDQYVTELTGANSIDNKFSPNIGAGLYYHTNKFYFGISIPNFLETQHFDTSSSSSDASTYIAEERINYYLISGYVFDLSDDWVIKPAVLTKWVAGAPLQVDLSTSVWYQQKLTLGVGYRWSAAWSVLAGFQIGDKMMIGLAYDRETTDLGNTTFNDGSYEVFLRFELFKDYDKIISPRFF